MGEKVQRYQKKGSVVQVIGKMKSSKKDKTTYWELCANNIVFFTFDNNSNQQQNNFEMFTGDINISDDDLPF
ncbi:single-stranded DNA-binding protein [Bacillus cereus]